LRWLPEVRPDWHWHVFLLDRDLREFDDPPVSTRVTLERVRNGHMPWQRPWWANCRLPERVSAVGADILFSLTNIAPSRPVRPQVVYCHQRKAFPGAGVPVWLLAQRLRLLVMRKLIVRGALASEAVIVQTNAMREQIETSEPRLRGRVRVIPSGYRTLSRDPVLRRSVRDALARCSRPRLIYVTHPGVHKNHLALVRALPTIVKHEPSASLLLTLDPEHAHAAYRRQLRMIEGETRRLGVAGHVVWLGVLSPDEVHFALRESDLLVFPSLAESFGLGLVEAMAAACPIAASDLPYAHDVAGDAAVYFKPRCPDSIAGCVVEALRGSNRASLATASALRSQRYAYPEIAERVARVLVESLTW